jgi:hypothetical protein
LQLAADTESFLPEAKIAGRMTGHYRGIALIRICGEFDVVSAPLLKGIRHCPSGLYSG